MRFLPAFSLLVLVGLTPAPIRADPFSIDLEAKAGQATKKAQAETADGKHQPRGMLTLKAGVPITVKWSLTNTGPAAAKDVLVHFFAVKAEKADQQTVPALTKGVAAESALTMDFNPKDNTEGELTFTIGQAGVYLIRVETKDAAGKNAPKYFAALDLMVQ